MKRISLRRERAKAFFILMLLCLGLFSAKPLSAQTGASCATVIAMPAHNGYDLSETTTYTDTWYSFVTDSANIQIDVFNSDLSPTGISSISLYSGICSGLTLITPTGTPILGENLSYTYSGLSLSTTYYVKFSKGNTTSTTYGYSLMNLKTNAATCSAGCPANPNNNANNTCQSVCNGGFEYILDSIYGISELYKACPWDATGQNDWQGGSPDAFNINTSHNTTGYRCGVPNNFAGYQNPLHGNGYAGFITYAAPATNLREYVVEPLNTPLLAGKKYTVSFWVNLGGRAGYATSGIGAWLSNTNPNALGEAGILAQNPQIKGSLYNSVITDTTSWVYITDTFTVPTGNTYYYVAIGCFKNDASNGHTAVSHTSSSGWGPNSIGSLGYYYVDEVSIIPYGSVSVIVSPSPVCNGDPVKLVATSSIGSGYYLWSTNPSTSITYDHAPYYDTVYSVPASITSTMYTVTTNVPSYGNCTISDSIKPTWLAGPVGVSAGADQSICLGGTATLTGTLSGQYTSTSWKISGGGTLCSGCTSTSVSPVMTTSYVFIATNSATGCTMQDTMTVTVSPIPVTIVMPSGANTCSGCYNFTTSQSYSSYTWSSNAVSSSCNSCATYNACYNSSFTAPSAPVSVSVIDAQGCQGSAVVYVPQCCHDSTAEGYPFELVVNDSSSHMPTSHPALGFTWNAATQYYEVTNKKFTINGQFFVDKNTRFYGCEVTMGPTAKIIVRPGIKFELTAATGPIFTMLHSGCGDMWDGIYVDGTNATSKVTVLSGTVIEDAQNAIVSTNGGNYLIDGTSYPVKFNKNYIGIMVKPYTGTHPGVVKKAIFSCDSPSQTGGTTGITYSGTNLRPPVSDIGFAGIYVDNCSDVTVGDTSNILNRNLFERTKFGIYSVKSSVKVQNNDFKYFSIPQLTKIHPNQGVAVYATNQQSATARTLTVGQVGTKKACNYFLKCAYGVLATAQMNLSCKFNRLDSCSYMAIYSLQNFAGKTIVIDADTMYECTGNNISCIGANNSTITITRNAINQSQSVSTTNFGQTGIYVANAVMTAPVNLTIQYNAIRKMRNGIWVSYVKRPLITDNSPITIVPGGPYTASYPGTCIRIDKCYGAVVRQNTMSYNSTPTSTQYDKIFGIYIENCKADTVSKNSITKMGSGIYMRTADNPSVIACNTMTTCVIGINFGYTNANWTPVSLNSQLYWGSSTSPSATGNQWSGCTNSLKGRITSPNGIDWYYTNSGNYIPSSINMYALSFTNFNTPQSTGNGDKCSYMLAPPNQTDVTRRTVQLEGICKTPRTYDTLSSDFQYDDAFFAYRTLLDNPSWTSLGGADDSYYSGYVSTQSSTNIGKFADVENEINNGNVSAAGTKLAAITPSGTKETNRWIVLDMYLRTWALDSMNLSEDQKDTLRTIAHQGVLTGGPAVMDARTMLQEEIHDSSNVRLSNPQTGEMQQGIAVGNIYPNPTTGQVSINADLPEAQTGTMELFDLTGRKVANWQLTGGQSVYTFDASFLPAGTYIYRIMTAGEILRTDRLIIMKQD